MAGTSAHSAETRVLTSLLRKFRQDANLTQFQMAKKLRVSQSAISKIERGEIRLDLVQLRRWCLATGISLVELASAFEHGATHGRTGKAAS